MAQERNRVVFASMLRGLPGVNGELACVASCPCPAAPAGNPAYFPRRSTR